MTVENVVNSIIDEIVRQQREYTEKTLAEIITKYDFIVGSKECKYRLMKILPYGANVVCSPFIESPTMIYAIKKFDLMDFIIEPQEGEDNQYNREKCYECCNKDKSVLDMPCCKCSSENDYIYFNAHDWEYESIEESEDKND